MKYTPVDIEENVNISKVSPLVQAFQIMAGFFIVVAALFVVCSIFADFIVQYIPIEWEHKLFVKNTKSKYPQTQAKLNELVQGLCKKTKSKNCKYYKLNIITCKQPNAYASLGGQILVTDSFLKFIKSENELSFVLSHELSHIINKDPEKNLSRQILMGLILSIFTQDAKVAEIMNYSANNVTLAYSREVEKRADLEAVETINNYYGNTAGSIDLFERIMKKDKNPEIFYYFSTHPPYQSRIENIKNYIKENNYFYNSSQKRPIKFVEKKIKK